MDPSCRLVRRGIPSRYGRHGDFGVSPWAGFAVSSGILYAARRCATPVAFVLTDFTAMLIAVAAVASLVWLTARRNDVVP